MVSQFQLLNREIEEIGAKCDCVHLNYFSIRERVLCSLIDNNDNGNGFLFYFILFYFLLVCFANQFVSKVFYILSARRRITIVVSSSTIRFVHSPNDGQWRMEQLMRTIGCVIEKAIDQWYVRMRLIMGKLSSRLRSMKCDATWISPFDRWGDVWVLSWISLSILNDWCLHSNVCACLCVCVCVERGNIIDDPWRITIANDARSEREFSHHLSTLRRLILLQSNERG